MFFIKIYIKESYMNYYDTSIQMCGQYCILARLETLNTKLSKDCECVMTFQFNYLTS